LKKYAIKIFIELCQGKNLFIKYDADNFTYEGYLEKYFLSLPTNEEEAIKSIKKYVRSYGKNLVS
jgi:predicted Zn-dependent peptidase